jgi:hypothetical protein
MILPTIAMVTAIQRHNSCGVSGLPENYFLDDWKPGNGFRTWQRLGFLRFPFCLMDLVA